MISQAQLQKSNNLNSSVKYVDIWHNILWSKYKGGVFSALHYLQNDELKFNFFQIAKTENDRVGLGSVDMSYHTYPFSQVFDGAYEKVPATMRFLKLFKMVWQSHSDLIVLPGYHRPEYWGMLLACILTGKRRAVFCDSTAYDHPYRPARALAKRLFFKRCHGFFAYGERSREYLEANSARADWIYTRCQAAALPHDFDPEIMRQARIQYQQQKDPMRFLYVGRLSPEKRLQDLLEAMVRVRETRTDAILVLVGSGPESQTLKAQAQSLGLGDAVQFPGSMDIAALSQEYLKATCLVLPSQSEPWGLVVNEALSFGCPVVVSDACGCVPELVSDGVTGFAFPMGHTQTLADRMLRIETLGTPDAVARTCQERISHFTPAKAASQIQHGCAQILAEGRC